MICQMVYEAIAYLLTSFYLYLTVYLCNFCVYLDLNCEYCCVLKELKKRNK